MVDGCQCYQCLLDSGKKTEEGHLVANTRFIVCVSCGNKRCPHATNHVFACTHSNEPGQKGSSYE